MIPTNKSGESGIIDHSGRLVINDNIRYEIALGNAYRFAHIFSAVAKDATGTILFDPSLNGAYTDRHYKIKAYITATAAPVKMEFYEDAEVSANGTESPRD